MNKAIDRRFKMIDGFLRRIFLYQFRQDIVVAEGEEYGFYVGIGDAHVLHAIIFLVTTCQFMFFMLPFM